MRLAVITDIHGNVAALEAALDDIAARGIADILCLGDCASGMMWPGETTALLMQRAIPTVRGNHDRWLLEHAPEAMGKLLDATQREQFEALRREERSGRNGPGADQLR